MNKECLTNSYRSHASNRMSVFICALGALVVFAASGCMDDNSMSVGRQSLSIDQEQDFVVDTCTTAKGEDDRLIVYNTVPGAEVSDQYSLAVKPAGSEEPWRQAFAFITRCKKGIIEANNYFPNLSNWSNTYVNFEMGGSVEVEISKANGQPIRKAEIHPQRKASSCFVRDGKAYVI
jgi:hypothetical protein